MLQTCVLYFYIETSTTKSQLKFHAVLTLISNKLAEVETKDPFVEQK